MNIKKLLYLSLSLLITTCLFFVSCNDDKDDNNSFEETIVGRLKRKICLSNPTIVSIYDPFRCTFRRYVVSLYDQFSRKSRARNEYYYLSQPEFNIPIGNAFVPLDASAAEPLETISYSASHGTLPGGLK